MTVDDLLDGIIEREGGYVDHPADRGGPTNYGITLATFNEALADPDYALHPSSTIKGLSKSEAKAIYAAKYLIKPKIIAIAPPLLCAFVFDCAVHHGPATAIKWLQRAAGAEDDGRIGPATLARVNAPYAEAYLLNAVIAQRLQHFGRLITKDPSQAVFAHGWMNRVAGLMGWV